MAEPVLIADNVSKKFCANLRRNMLYGSIDALRAMAGLGAPRPVLRESEFWALRDVTIELRAGHAIGIIGRNGSGKTTLLRILNGIFPPTSGCIRYRGRMSALIAVGAGFHPHMTGRENIHLNAAILGMSRAHVRRCFDSIVAFADIGRFLEAPVSTYSSGMVVRLGFAIAVHAEPTTLLADEILAVGDLGFTLKCYRRIADYRRNGGALLLVSHSMQLVRNTCDRVYWLDEGRVRASGDATDICREYQTSLLTSGHDQEAENERASHNLDPAARIRDVLFLDADGLPVTTIRAGDSLTIRIHYACHRRVQRPIFTLGLSSLDTLGVMNLYSSRDGRDAPDLSGEGFVDVSVDSMPIKPNAYLLTATFAEAELVNVLDWHERCYRLNIAGSESLQHGIYQPRETWKFHPAATGEESGT